MTSATFLLLMFSFGSILKGKCLSGVRNEDDMNRSKYPIEGIVQGQD